MIAFIQAHRSHYGVEPMCRVLQIAPSTFYEQQAIARDPSLVSDRAKRDEELRRELLRVWQENRSLYGARKLWHAMKREKISIARCTVERLMRDIGIEGVRRGKKVKTTYGQPADACPLDKVNRQFRALMPNQLWVSDFTFVSTWREFVLCGFRHRHFCQSDCGLESINEPRHSVRAGCFGTGDPRPSSSRTSYPSF